MPDGEHHLVEGLRYCLGYTAADPGLLVSLLLNAAILLAAYHHRTYLT